MQHHIDSSKVNHDIMLLLTVKTLKEKSEQKDLEIAQLKEWNTKKDETINAMEQDIGSLKKELVDVQVQLATQKENNEIKQSNEVNENKRNIDNLQKFADTVSKLHLTLSQPLLRKNDHYDIPLFKEIYDGQGFVKEWNKIVDRVNEDGRVNCQYLENLRNSINQYSETIFSRAYKERFRNLCYTTPIGTGYPFVRIGCRTSIKFIRVKSFNQMGDFNREVRKNNERRYCKVQNVQYVFSYYDNNDIIYVVLWGRYNVQLLHKSDEGKKINLPNGEVVKVENIKGSFIVNDSIVLYVTYT